MARERPGHRRAAARTGQRREVRTMTVFHTSAHSAIGHLDHLQAAAD
ncbi:hypothetical protein GL263_11025 [Streptomyces durbertensis]|uniref:Uncharacterized protein n=1 Tax=Streptomyces durbertensis TaxID=2448886 RepID=A0ABR6EFH9_9ACTN|nr:hypothetical protein [Streptomyces durbertensis]MBB1244086.1 hypothetical protein [Streptomyces durbertensis]